MTTRGLSTALPLIAALLAVGCGKPAAEIAKPTSEPAPAPASAGPTGSVAGKVTFNGTKPKLKPIAMDSDPVCAAKHSGPVTPEVIVPNSNGTLRNVFVYVKTGLEGKTFPVPAEPVTIDQDGCLYKPRVLGMMAKQPLRIKTSDNTQHNIHPMPNQNAEWNVSQQPGSDPILQTFARAEVSIPVVCNQHPWMKALIHVLPHPYFAVTGVDGTFEIKGLPPGNYELEAIHERLGAAAQKIAIDPAKPVSVTFSMGSAQAFRPASLPVMPAFVVR